MGREYILSCNKCYNEQAFTSSKKIGQRRTSYEVNTRDVLAMTMTGNGLTGLRMFCEVTDLLPPVFVGAFDKIQDKILKVTKTEADESTRRAVEEEINIIKATQEDKILEIHEEQEEAEEEENHANCPHNYKEEGSNSDIQIDKYYEENLPTNLKVKGDGTWQKRGRKSLNGVVSVIRTKTEKIIDYEVLSSHCELCSEWQKKNKAEDGPEWQARYAKHKIKYNSNFKGSSGGMESADMLYIAPSAAYW